MFSQTIRAIARPFVTAFAVAALLLPVAVRAEEAGSYACPVLGTAIESVTKDTLSFDYKGVRYYFCCESCKPQFDKTPDKFLKDNKGKINGVSLFDPLTTKRILPEKAAAHSDLGGVRYFFASPDEKTTFDKEPKKYAAPKKELLFCPVSNEVVEAYAKAPDYSDYNGTRYYFCCDGCKPQFDKNPAKYLDGLDARMKAKLAEPKKDGDK